MEECTNFGRVLVFNTPHAMARFIGRLDIPLKSTRYSSMISISFAQSFTCDRGNLFVC